MSYEDLPALTIDVSDGVATVTIDHPPLNLMDAVLLPSLRAFVARVRDDADVRVIVFESADPEFFVAHGDMAYLTDPDALPAATRAAIAAAPGSTVPEGLNILQAMSEEVRSLPQVTIGKLAGFARGAGNEFFMYLDMRFAAIGKSGQAQPVSLMGILPGGGGTVNMTRLAGRARALELILGAELVGAELAERYGLINRALPAAELDPFVDTLARRIAGLRPGTPDNRPLIGRTDLDGLLVATGHHRHGVLLAPATADAMARITKVLPKLPAAKRKLLLSAFLLRDPGGEAVVDSKGRPEPDPELRVQESIPLAIPAICAAPTAMSVDVLRRSMRMSPARNWTGRPHDSSVRSPTATANGWPST
jgi:enoyl-CoA hydratase/carnithine racemase